VSGHEVSGHRLDVSPLHPLHPLPHGRLVDQVRLEHETERFAFVIDESKYARIAPATRSLLSPVAAIASRTFRTMTSQCVSNNAR